MIKALLWIAVGAAGALELEKRLGGVRERIRPRAITDSMFDRVNQQLEKHQPPTAP
jgi:hypothetical protein